MNILVLTPGCSGYPIIQSYSKVAGKVFLLGFRKYEKKFNFHLDKAKWPENIELIYVDSWKEYYKKAKEIIRTEQVRVVLTQEPYGNLIGWKILHGYDIRLINMMCQDYIEYIRVSDEPFYKRYSLILLNWICLKVSSRRAEIIALSRDLEKKAKRYGSKNVTLLPIYGINLDIFKPAKHKKFNPDKPRLLVVARLSPEKGHKYLFETIKLIKDETKKDIELHVVGGGPLEEQLSELKDELDLKENIIMYGYLSHEQVAEQYNEADLFILPSLEEGLGYVSGEALACRCPVVASNVGGIPDIVIDHKTGLLFEPVNVQDMKDKIMMMLEDRRRAMEMAESGRQHIIKNYDSKKVMGRFEGLLRDNGKV